MLGAEWADSDVDLYTTAGIQLPASSSPVLAQFWPSSSLLLGMLISNRLNLPKVRANLMEMGLRRLPYVISYPERLMGGR